MGHISNLSLSWDKRGIRAKTAHNNNNNNNNNNKIKRIKNENNKRKMGGSGERDRVERE